MCQQPSTGLAAGQQVSTATHKSSAAEQQCNIEKRDGMLAELSASPGGATAVRTAGLCARGCALRQPPTCKGV